MGKSRRRKSGRRKPGRRSKCRQRLGERGFLSGWVALAFWIALITGVAILFSKGVPLFLEKMGKGVHLEVLMIHAPGMDHYPLSDEADAFVSEKVLEEHGDVEHFLSNISSTMGDLYGTTRLIAFVAMIGAAIFLGITYVSEHFHLVGRGTAMQLLSESALILVLLFIFPIIYNAAACLSNGVNEGIILHAETEKGTATPEDMVNEVVRAATRWPTDINFPGQEIFPIANIPSAIVALICGTATFAAIFTAFVMGVFRILAIGVLAAGFPIILVFRLIPPLREFGTSLQSTFVGLFVGSLLAALIFRIAWGVFSFSDIPGGSLRWAIGIGTLIAAALMLTVTARAFSGIARGVSGTMTGAASGVIGGTIAAAGGAAIGAQLGGLGAVRSIRGFGKAAEAGRVGLGAAVAKTKHLFAGTAAGMLAGARGGPVGAVVGAPHAGMGAAEKSIEGHMDLGDIEKTEEAFKNYFTGNKYLEARGELIGDRKGKELYSSTAVSQNVLRGKMLYSRLRKGEIGDDELRKMFVVAKYGETNPKRIAKIASSLKKKGDITPKEIRIGLLNALEEGADQTSVDKDWEIGLRTQLLHNTVHGRPRFDKAGEGLVVGIGGGISQGGKKGEINIKPQSKEPSLPPESLPPDYVEDPTVKRIKNHMAQFIKNLLKKEGVGKRNASKER